MLGAACKVSVRGSVSRKNKNLAAERDQALSDALLRSAKGDSAAFQTVYALTSPQLTAIIENMVGNPHLAKDILQNAYLSIWKSAHRYDPEKGRPFTWMLVITRNRAIDLLRKQKRRKEDEPVDRDMIDRTTPLPDEQTRARMLREQILPGLNALPEHVRTAIIMHVVEDYTTAEIGEHFDVPTNTAKSWVRRGLAKMRGHIESDLKDDIG